MKGSGAIRGATGRRRATPGWRRMVAACGSILVSACVEESPDVVVASGSYDFSAGSPTATDRPASGFVVRGAKGGIALVWDHLQALPTVQDTPIAIVRLNDDGAPNGTILEGPLQVPQGALAVGDAYWIYGSDLRAPDSMGPSSDLFVVGSDDVLRVVASGGRGGRGFWLGDRAVFTTASGLTVLNKEAEITGQIPLEPAPDLDGMVLPAPDGSLLTLTWISRSVSCVDVGCEAPSVCEPEFGYCKSETDYAPLTEHRLLAQAVAPGAMTSVALALTDWGKLDPEETVGWACGDACWTVRVHQRLVDVHLDDGSLATSESRPSALPGRIERMAATNQALLLSSAMSLSAASLDGQLIDWEVELDASTRDALQTIPVADNRFWFVYGAKDGALTLRDLRLPM